MSARSPGLDRLGRRRRARRAGSRRWRCRRRCPPRRAARASGARRRADRPRTASRQHRLVVQLGDEALVEVAQAVDQLAVARLGGDDLRRSGTCSRRNRPTPISVPVVPSPATKCVIDGQVREDLRPGASRSAPRRWPGCRTGRASPSRGAPRRAPWRRGRPRWSRRPPGEEMISAPHISSSWRALDRGVLRHHADQPVAR